MANIFSPKLVARLCAVVNERSDGIWSDRWAGGMIQIVFVIFCPLLRFLLPTFILANARWIVEIQKHHYDDDGVLPGGSSYIKGETTRGG